MLALKVLTVKHEDLQCQRQLLQTLQNSLLSSHNQYPSHQRMAGRAIDNPESPPRPCSGHKADPWTAR